ncbi:MAG: T9SS type A sorting domain-containing protein [Saprospiraceae bacterium]|nr:T9SS type A sorting domain-containing protein [Saprospiraceae bacterium]
MQAVVYALFTLAQTAVAQKILVPEWIKFESSATGQKTEGWGVSVDAEGHIYWPFNSNSSGMGLDLYCRKLDEKGTDLWPAPLFYGGIGNQQNFVCQVKDSFLYIGGRHCPLTVNSCDMLLLKVDKISGRIIWDKKMDFGQNGYDEMDGLVVDDENIYCGGWSQVIEAGNFMTDIGLWKMDLNGNTIWVNSLGMPGTAEHQDGHFVVDDQFIFASGLWGGKGIFNVYDGSAFLGKFSKTNGSIIDSVLFGNTSESYINAENALGMTSDGLHLYVTGYSTPVANNWQIFTAKFDKNLRSLWYKLWGGSSTESARAIAVNDYYVLVAGQTNSIEYSSGNKSDAVLLVYDLDGNLISQQTWGNPSTDEAFQDMAIVDDKVYLSGNVGNNIGAGLTDSAFLMKLHLDSLISSNRNEKTNEIFQIKVGTNWNHSSLNIDIYPDLENTSIHLFNSIGQNSAHIIQTSNQSIRIDIGNLTEGIYYLQVIWLDRKMNLTKKILISKFN